MRRDDLANNSSMTSGSVIRVSRIALNRLREIVDLIINVEVD